MKLRRISIGVSDILIFELGTDAQRAIWNHVCDGTSCIDSEFELSIKPLLAAHGIYDIHIKDMPVRNKDEHLPIAIEEDGDEILYLPETCVKCSSDKPLIMKLETRDWCCPDCGASYGSDENR